MKIFFSGLKNLCSLKNICHGFVLFGSVIAHLSHVNLAWTQSIQLQPHQKVVTQYLMQHPHQKGLLLYHSLGSGKTYIALEHAEKRPHQKVVIILPEFLKSNWMTQMKSYGVHNPSRYELMALEEVDRILSTDLSESLVILDEVHKLIQRIRESQVVDSEKMIQVYLKLQSAQQLLLLTGTPVFTDVADLAYLANLLIPGNPYPIDPLQFKTQFMKISPVTSLVRGHLTESKLMLLAVPFFVAISAVVTLGTSLPWAVPLVAMGGSAAIPLVNEIVPARQVSFRHFDVEKWKDFAENYISFYDVKVVENNDYPNKVILQKKVLYNAHQASFFLDFIDESMNLDELKVLLSDQTNHYSDEYLKFHSSQLQKQLLSQVTSGMEIGNLDFMDENNQFIEAPKFEEILQIIQSQPGQVAIYSNYLHQGLQKFAKFLDRKGLKNQWLFLDARSSVKEQMSILECYNRAEKRILLIHPEITEGISLKGTEQFHILEPIRNEALLEQIIGRSVRYQSHLHLPQERQKVTVYLWESSVEYSQFFVPTLAGRIRREHWQKNYAEMNPSAWTKGIVELDTNYFLKNETPDARVNRNKSVLTQEIKSLKSFLSNMSIEHRVL